MENFLALGRNLSQITPKNHTWISQGVFVFWVKIITRWRKKNTATFYSAVGLEVFINHNNIDDHNNIIHNTSTTTTTTKTPAASSNNEDRCDQVV